VPLVSLQQRVPQPWLLAGDLQTFYLSQWSLQCLVYAMSTLRPPQGAERKPLEQLMQSLPRLAAALSKCCLAYFQKVEPSGVRVLFAARRPCVAAQQLPRACLLRRAVPLCAQGTG
jgi:hypothetical protein